MRPLAKKWAIKNPIALKQRVGYRAPQYGDIKEKQWHKLRLHLKRKVLSTDEKSAILGEI